jgi:DNA-binding NarL/FixJ family response regulator
VTLTRPLIIVGNPHLKKRIESALEILRARSGAEAPDSPNLPFAGSRRLIILGSSRMARLKTKRPAWLSTIERRAWVIVAIERRDAATLLEAAERADGVIFARGPADRLSLVLSLAQIGYCVMPPSVARRASRGSLRRELLPLLTPAQTEALRFLGLGVTDSDISLALQVSLVRTKYLIRSLLKVLHLRNRTQAAVFARSEAFPRGDWAAGRRDYGGRDRGRYHGSPAQR